MERLSFAPFPPRGRTSSNSTDLYSASCQHEAGGNRVVDVGEECDDGDTTDGGDGYSATCKLECGNGDLDPGEECDDSNTKGGDLCSVTCQEEVCGNGVVDVGEECDDGDTDGGDGCSATCKLECGNAGEECDLCDGTPIIRTVPCEGEDVIELDLVSGTTYTIDVQRVDAAI
jgi:cysteine-rich repeat protein